MALFDMLQERSAKGDFSSSLDINFDAEDQQRVVSAVPASLFWKYFKILLRGSHPGLVHSVDLVNTLGSTTVFCCVDKDGVLSEPVWPVEEINLLQENIVSLELSPEIENGIPTVHFNDTEWRDYLPVLKPLGLNCLLNRTCCDPVSNADGQNSTAQDSAKLRFIRAREKAHGVATQCVCQLGKKIGFLDDAFDEFVRLKELHTIAPIAGKDVDHSPYMISLVVKDSSGTLQLLCKGSPDLITSHCSSYWDGEALRAFRAEEQQKINELYNKIIDKGGHCIAFAYKSVKPIYNLLFEESNVNSPIVDVRVSPVHFINATSTSNTDGYSPLSPNIETRDDMGSDVDTQARGDLQSVEGHNNRASGSGQEINRHTAASNSNTTPITTGTNNANANSFSVNNISTNDITTNTDPPTEPAQNTTSPAGEKDLGGKRDSGSVHTGSPDFIRKRRDRGDDSGDASTYSHDTSDSVHPRRDKRKGKGERGKDHRGDELHDSNLRNSHKIIQDNSDEEVKDARKKHKKLQTQLRFTDSADSSERDREEREREKDRELRKARKTEETRRRRRVKGNQDEDLELNEEEDKRKHSSEDVRKRAHRTTKRRAEEVNDSSSTSTSEEEKTRKRTKNHRKNSSSSSGETSGSEVVADDRIRKARAAHDERKKRRAKRDESDSSSYTSETSTSTESSDDKRRKKRGIKKETSKDILVRGKKKEHKKRGAPRSPRRTRDEDSCSERGSRRHSLEEDKRTKAMERKRSREDINRRSPQETSVRKDITEDEVSCIESDPGETVTLEKLQADQIFIGMISMRELPKLHTNNFVDVLREAGVRFVLFSSEPRFACNHFAHKLGLETDWNCCVSLRDPGPNEPHVQDEPSKLPRGISSVRAHLEQVDNVPLLVPLFCDAGPAEKQEMIKILQENGEVVCCVGSALNCANIPIFSQANVSFALEPLLRRCHNRDRDTSDSRPLLTSRLMFENAPNKEPASTHSLAIDMNSIPCSLVYHRHTDWNEILELLQLSRQMLTNVRHSLLYYAAGCIWLAFVVLLGGIFGLSFNIRYVNTVAGVPLTGLQVVWMTCIILPLFAISLVTCPADPDIMHMLNGKNLPEYRLRGISKFSWYMAIRMAPSIMLTTILFLWSVEVVWTPSNWGNVFGKDMSNVQTTDYGKALVIGQNVLMFASVYYLAITSASFHSHTTSIINFNPFRNVTWFVCTLLGIVLQIIFFVISLAVSDSFSEMSELPWYLYVVLFLWAGGLLFIDEFMKKMYRKWFKRFQLELRLEFDTKLGMHSPI